MWELVKVISILDEMAEDDDDGNALVCCVLAAQLRKVGAFMDRLPDGVSLLATPDEGAAE
jgi:hypothetical protein